MSEDKKVSDLERWALESAAQLAPSAEGMDRIRIAVGLIQARAKEAQRYSGKFAVGGYLAAINRDAGRIGVGIEAGIAMAFGDRHEKLEIFAMEMAQRHIAAEEKPRVIQ